MWLDLESLRQPFVTFSFSVARCFSLEGQELVTVILILLPPRLNLCRNTLAKIIDKAVKAVKDSNYPLLLL